MDWAMAHYSLDQLDYYHYCCHLQINKPAFLSSVHTIVRHRGNSNKNALNDPWPILKMPWLMCDILTTPHDCAQLMRYFALILNCPKIFRITHDSYQSYALSWGVVRLQKTSWRFCARPPTSQNRGRIMYICTFLYKVIPMWPGLLLIGVGERHIADKFDKCPIVFSLNTNICPTAKTRRNGKCAIISEPKKYHCSPWQICMHSDWDASLGSIVLHTVRLIDEQTVKKI